MGIFRGYFLFLLLGISWLSVKGQPQIERIDASAYPMVTIWLQGEMNTVPASALTIYDGASQAALQTWDPGQVDAPLKLALLIDRSQDMRQPGQSWDEPQSRLDQLKAVGGNLLEALRPQTDSALLIHFGGSIDNTDVSDNFMVLSMILDGVEPYGDRVLRDAVVYAMDALRGQAGDKGILALVGGPDQGSVASLTRVIHMAEQTGIPVMVGALQDQVTPQLKELAQTTGGAMVHAANPTLLGSRVDSLLRAWRGRHQLVYQAPVEADGDIRLGIRSSVGDTLWVEGKYAPPKELYAAMQANQAPATRWPWWTYLVPVVLAVIGAGAWFTGRFLKQRRRATVISPTITSLAVDQRKGRLLLQFNLPKGRIPARVSLFTYAGRPVHDQVVPSHHSRTKVDLNGLEEGVYHCMLSHAGQTSDEWEFVWERPR